ncbi:hypothetical protein B296_00001104 [Ensete ventricosum]|uniref:Uncharacterized protein n=1 Tax=Ensete ventricosum TaxID=4639 RepID=A0A426Z8X2_ENSVE|nr:hypothetical protein B296_00001104 [Ensete ventricosum]
MGQSYYLTLTNDVVVHRWRLPCPRAAAPAVGNAALGRLPLWASTILAGGTSTSTTPYWQLLLQVIALAGGASLVGGLPTGVAPTADRQLVGCCPYGWLPVVGWPRATVRTCCNLAVAGHPLSSLPSLQKHSKNA